MKKPPLMQRLRAKKQSKSLLIGVVWYADEKSWQEVKSAARDPDLFEATYAEWVAMAGEAFAQIEIAGANVVKYSMVPGEFLAWCLAHGRENNAASRSEFVAQAVQQGSKSGA